MSDDFKKKPNWGNPAAGANLKRNTKKLHNSAEILQHIFKESSAPLSQSFERWKLWRRWGEIVGATLSKVTEPVGLKNRNLIVWVKNSTWMHQVTFSKVAMIEAINSKWDKSIIDDITFTLSRNHVPMDSNLKEELQKSIDGINPKK